MRIPWKIPLLIGGLLLTGFAASQAQTVYELQAQFDNPWHSGDTNGPDATSAWSGHVGKYKIPLTANEPKVPATPDKQFQLARSAIAQLCALRRPDFQLGQVVTAPIGADLSSPPARIFPDTTAFYVPSKQQVVAADRGLVQIDWRMQDGSTNSLVYLISAVPYKRPARIFWTEAPYNAPQVDLSGKYVKLHFNSVLPDRGTNGLWVDDTTHQLRAAKDTWGMVIMEFFDTGSFRNQIGIEIVEVLEPHINLLSAYLGQRLLPLSSEYGFADLSAKITKGLNSTVEQHNSANGRSHFEGWVYAIKPTVADPWDLEIYWKNKGIMGVEWPFEADWYAADWPPDTLAQLYVRSGDNTNGTVSFPDSLSVDSLKYEDPPRHAFLALDKRSFYTTGEGYALIRYQDNSGDDVWYEVVHSVSRTNTILYNRDAVDWPIGQELLPAQVHTAMQFNGADGSIEIPSSARSVYTMEFWVQPVSTTNINLALSQGGSGSSARLKQLRLDANGQFEHSVALTNGNRVTITGSTTAQPGQWYHVAGVVDASGLVRLYVNGLQEGQPQYRAADLAQGQTNTFVLGGQSTAEGSGYFDGRLRDFHVWSRGLSSEELLLVMTQRLDGTEPDLVHCLNFEAATSGKVHDLAGDGDAIIRGGVTPGTFAGPPDPAYTSGAPGYLNQDEGDMYNPHLYTWPSTNSHLFAVNTLTNHDVMEVWWCNARRQPYMPASVFWPSLVIRYRNVWPTDAPELIIAGQNSDTTGLLPEWFVSPFIYVQNDSTQPGYNPNEEHALLLAGQVYAIRDDLNTTDSSAPYVLVQYTDLFSGSPQMQVFHVVETNAQYQFRQDLVAGTLIQPPMPLTLLNQCSKSSFEPTNGPAWRDRKLDFWAIAAANDGVDTTNIVTRYYYPMQPGFFFPGQQTQPALGSELPWLSHHGTSGTPIAYTYTIRWPDAVPVMFLGQTLTDPTAGLPAIRGQKSVTLLYQQCSKTNQQQSVLLIDPTQARSVSLAALPDDVTTESFAGKSYFPLLPPHLRDRLYYDPDRHWLTLIGQYNEDEAYLLLNVLSGAPDDPKSDRYKVLNLSASSTWKSAVNQLATDSVVLPDDNTPFDSLALSATVGQNQGVGYLTFAFNNSTEFCDPPDPISVAIIRVESPLYRGGIKVIFSDNPLDEKLTLRHSSDFAGRAQDYEFDWRSLPPSDDGTPPSDARESWPAFVQGSGYNSVTIEGPGIRTLSDNYLVCRYRPLNHTGPTKDQWSDWTDPMLAEGWIKRALNGINPFEQRIKNLQDNEVNTVVSLISQAGARWVGEVPLNLQNVNDYGLIEIYETILKRGEMLSINANLNYSPANDALLLAAGRISDLYMALGNEAYADAQDPTISFSTSDRAVYGAAWSSIFCFMNQVPTLLDEELALLRGRDDSVQPSVHTYPFYNRLIWNFTKGMNGGEAAYALNYSVRNEDGDPSGTITEADARRLYPQGHGDAWGHYLTALTGYYQLLQNSNFIWIPRTESMIIGGVTVTVDYYDERKFAAAAAAKARTGVEIVDLTHRAYYTESSTGLWSGYRDGNTNRAWGVAEWGCRAGQGALFDWVVANSLLPDQDPNPTHAGLQKVDRTTVTELKEIATCLDNIQVKVDNADMGLNPLGLGRNVVPFDIDPTFLQVGSTVQGSGHFEQIYQRALVALKSAAQVAANAQSYSQLLRHQSDSLDDFRNTILDAERDYQNRLIELFGYPYNDDIGPGKTYAQGYDGPDLYHFNYVETTNLLRLSLPLSGSEDIVVTAHAMNWDGDFGFDINADDPFKDITLPTSQTLATNDVKTFTLDFDQMGLIKKPSGWTGSRRAQGELQTAYSDVLQAYYALEQAVREDAELDTQIQNAYDSITAQVTLSNDEMAAIAKATQKQKQYLQAKAAMDGIQATTDLLADYFTLDADAISTMFPTVLGLANDATSGARGAAKSVGSWLWLTDKLIGLGAQETGIGLDTTSQLDQMDLDFKLQKDQYANGAITVDIDALIRQESIKEVELQAKIEAVNQAIQRYRTVLAQGERLLAERTQFRAKWATQIQANRYADMAFRIFRNDALGKYKSAFDLAARYVYLAAKAYDFETALNANESQYTSGTDFLSSIARARSLGAIQDGVPLTGSTTGDPGLADIMARMSANWNVLKGRFGFNNPNNEYNVFSLRAELFRIASPADTNALAASDTTWRNTLWNFKVDNVLELPEFRRYCLPFAPVSATEPALVIPFSTYILARKNLFGRSMAGGDSSYDSSHFATKIRSVGVFFKNFNTAFGGGLNNTPRVYLIPVGLDVQRSPTDSLGIPRTWKILDQALPVPYDLDAGQLAQPDWIPLIDEVAGGFAAIRKFASFRAYHDSGTFDTSQMCSSSRLIGRSIWNTQWVLIIPASTLHSDTDHALEWFINGVNGDGNGVKDINLLFQTYSYSGN